ncbi:MAG TPA: hypothetical protein VF796_14100 [Humisphaera sp.]
MRSPLRQIPSLGRRRRRPAATEVLLAVPRVSPERELAVLRALMKPQAGRALVHQIDNGEQPWNERSAARAAAAAGLARAHLGWGGDVVFPPAGEYHALATFPAEAMPTALAVALLLSRALPGAWVVVGRLFVLDEVVHRRERGVKLTLRPARDVHLPREVRAAYRRAAAALAPA